MYNIEYFQNSQINKLKIIQYCTHSNKIDSETLLPIMFKDHPLRLKANTSNSHPFSKKVGGKLMYHYIIEISSQLKHKQIHITTITPTNMKYNY